MASQLIDGVFQTMEDKSECFENTGDIFHQILGADYDIFGRFKGGGKSVKRVVDIPPL
jgi:hypothetical protein